MKKFNFTFTYFISMLFIILFNLYLSTFYNTIEHFDNSGNDISNNDISNNDISNNDISNNDFNDFINKYEEKIKTYHDEVLHNNTLNLNIPNIDISGINIPNVNNIVTDIFSDSNTSTSYSNNNNSNFNYLTQVPCMSSTYKHQFKPISGF